MLLARSNSVEEAAASHHWHARWSGSLDLLLLMGALVAAAIFYPMATLNHDSSWYLIATRMWLDGAQLYQDVMETNPPLAFYLTAGPVMLADVFGISPKTSFCLSLVVAIGGSLVWVRFLLSRAEELTERQRHHLFLGLVLALILIPIGSFGQREHIMLVLSAPYFVLCIAQVRSAGRGERIALGTLAVLGFALKPHFLAAPLLLACVVAVQSRRFSALFCAQNIVIAAGCILYVCFVKLVHPEYFDVIVPLARLTYDTFNAAWSFVFLKPALFVLVLSVIFWKDMASDRIGWRILAICLGSLASYAIQSKGWIYHLLPVEAYLVVFCMWIAVSPTVPLRGIRSAAMAVLVIASIAPATLRGPYDSGPARALKPLASNGPANPRTLVLSSRVMVAFPLVNDLNGSWTSRYPHQWFLTGAIRKLGERPCIENPGECEDYRRAVQYALETNVEDFLKNAPQLVYVDSMKDKIYFGGVSFDYLEFLGQDPRFAEAWSRYHKSGEATGYELWILDETAISNRTDNTKVDAAQLKSISVSR